MLWFYTLVCIGSSSCIAQHNFPDYHSYGTEQACIAAGMLDPVIVGQPAVTNGNAPKERWGVVCSQIYLK